jgi:hypothetical protein
VGDTGLKIYPDSPEKTDDLQASAAKTLQNAPQNADLASLLGQWDSLSPADREAILRLARAAQQSEGGGR